MLRKCKVSRQTVLEGMNRIDRCVHVFMQTLRSFYLNLKISIRRFSHDLYLAIFSPRRHKKGMMVSDFFLYQNMGIEHMLSFLHGNFDFAFSSRNTCYSSRRDRRRIFMLPWLLFNFYFFILPVRPLLYFTFFFHEQQ